MSRRKIDQPFLDHLEELRGRIIKVLVLITLACFIVYGISDEILAFFAKPVGRLVFTSPGEAFGAIMMLTFWGGFLVSLPYILYQFWSFVAEALTKEERKYVLIFGPLSLIFFVSGCLFGYYAVLPVSLKFFLSFSSDVMVPYISVSRYISFITTIILSFGIVFELPLVVVFLAKIGIATPEFLSHQRKYAVLLIFFISTILTPPDVVSQILMAIPLLVLYEFGIVLARIFVKKNLAR